MKNWKKVAKNKRTHRVGGKENVWLGTPELMIIMAIAFLVFGGKKLPELGSGLGKGISSFKKGIKEIDETSTPDA